ncbi:prepilin-type N-terminal cleavage/methylation domain-containing protein [Caldimonas tepidiphila]|uniref:prepilin-type N-terminal cleavage/methylation domain-containing protein n=1 Tax=Caldimonas tepidiphila TaxID=2315841 RepID=UPI001F0BF316|nr:prepilin-type N-terminal cleavage/methylation domain-containing protein [Caldimonas tepidiphila]
MKPARGFTLLELLVVLSLMAVVIGTVALSLRDPALTRLEREADRLVALLESARAEARGAGLAVYWTPIAPEPGQPATRDFRFVGLPESIRLPERFLDPEVRATIHGANALRLGPEPLIGAQRVTLRLEERQITLATDGLQPFAVVSTEAGGAAR